MFKAGDEVVFKFIKEKVSALIAVRDIICDLGPYGLVLRQRGFYKIFTN